MGSLLDVETRLGLRLPVPLKRLFRDPPKLEHVYLQTPASLRTLRHVYSKIPPRMFHVFSDHAGNDYGLYLPRDGREPFAVYYDHEEYMLKPLTADLADFFGDPDGWAVVNPAHEKKWWEGSHSAWRRLLVNPKTSRPPELEVLKPMHLHYRALEGAAKSGWKKGTFVQLFRRWGAYDDRLRPMQRQFRCAGHLEDWRRWMAAAEEFAGEGAGIEALRAFDNAHAVKHTAVYWDLDWSTDVELFSRGRPILRKWGDLFDRAMVEAQLRRAREYAARE